MLAPALRKQLEKLMTTTYAGMPLPPFIQNFIDLGKVEGESKGKAEGKALGRAEAILALLEIRGVAVPDAVRAQVLRLHRPAHARPLVSAGGEAEVRFCRGALAAEAVAALVALSSRRRASPRVTPARAA